MVATDEKLTGLGGWLFLLISILIFGLYAEANFFANVFKSIYTVGLWDVVSQNFFNDPEIMHAEYIVAYYYIRLLIISAYIYVIILFYRKSAKFPMYLLAFVWARILIIYLTDIGIQLFVDILDETTTSDEYVNQVVVSIVISLYLVWSRRVKLTFVS